MKKIASILKSLSPLFLWIICVYFTLLFVNQGIKKFDPDGFWGPAFQRWGYPVWFMYLIGVIETVGGAIILWNRTAFYGAAALAVVMLGAGITRLIHGVSTPDMISIAFNFVAMLYVAGVFAEKRLK